MKLISLVLFLILTTPLIAHWSYFLIDITKLTETQRQDLVDKLNLATDGRYSSLKYYVINGTSTLTSTRAIVEAPTKIKENQWAKNLITVGIVQEFMTAEYVEKDGIRTVKRTKLFNHLTSKTSWYVPAYSVGTSTS